MSSARWTSFELLNLLHKHETRLKIVIPAQAGIQNVSISHWIPACAGMTSTKVLLSYSIYQEICMRGKFFRQTHILVVLLMLHAISGCLKHVQTRPEEPLTPKTSEVAKEADQAQGDW